MIIIDNATNVEEAADVVANWFLNGLYRTKKGRKDDGVYSVGEVRENEAARRAITMMRDMFKADDVYCPDKDTLLRDVPIPALKS